MSKVRFRFGSVQTTSQLPPLEAIRDAVEDAGIFGYEGNRRGAEAAYIGEDSLYINFVKEVGENVRRLDNNDDVVQRKEFFAREMRFFLLEDGTYGYETTRGVTEKDALSYLLEPFDLGFEIERVEELNLDQMRKFYKSRPKIRNVKVDNIGKREPNPTWPNEKIRELVEEAGEETDNSEFSVGHKNNNLKNVSIVDEGFARISDLTYVRARDENGNIQDLTDSGRFGFTVSSDISEDEKEASQRIRDEALRILREIIK